MKTLLLVVAALISFGVSAQVYVNPVIYNFGNSAQVQIHNNTEFDLSCSGTVNMNTQLGQIQTDYYSDQIRKGSFSIRSFYLMNMNDRINSVFHSIFCYQVP